MPGRLDVEVNQGAQFVFDGDFFDDLDLTEHDFTGEAVVWIVRRRRDPDAAEVTRATIDDGRVTVPALGQLAVRIPGSATSGFSPGCYWYWLSTWPVGVTDDQFDWLEGSFSVGAGSGI